jgi:glycosyltransferase involved in cell wall biosynthesis
LADARILVVTPALPLPFGGADARWQHVILTRLLSHVAHVTCLAVTGDDESRVTEARDSAAQHGYEFVHAPLHVPNSSRRRAGTLIRPHAHARFAPGVLAVLEALHPEAYDVVHVEHLFTSWLVRRSPRTVTYLHHLEAVDWEERAGLPARERFAHVQLRRATRRLLRSTDRMLAATDRVADDAVRWGARQRPTVVPVALDTSLYGVLPAVASPVVGVIGSMRWHPSLSAAERVLTRLWPRIHAAVPDARLVVAGRDSDEFLASYFPLDGAVLLGEVPHPTDFFGQVTVLLYPPPRGSGVKIKVLEALAYGVPVVSNREGLEGIDGDCVVRAETDDELVAGVVELLRGPTRRREMRVAGRAYVEQHYSAAGAVNRLVDAYRALGLVA